MAERKKRIRKNRKRENVPIVISPLPGDERYNAEIYKFIPTKDATPERIEGFLNYCRKHRGFPKEKVLITGETIYYMIVLNDNRTKNSLFGQAKNRYKFRVELSNLMTLEW